MKRLISLTISALLLVAAGTLAFRLIKRPEPVAAPESGDASEVRGEAPENPFRQDDPDWAKDKLGESRYTMKSSGCVVSCIAAALTYGGEEVTPGGLNALLSENGVYDSEGNLIWTNLEKLGFSVMVYDAADFADVDACLEEGRYPIVRVKMGGSGSTHYVLVTGGADGDYACMDPLADSPTSLTDYGGKIYAVRCVWKEEPKEE